MALAGAPRLILFDEPAAGLSPAERRELVALLRALPAHMGFVLIEHDLDIALRVVERVTVMHNGRLLKHGTPAEIENDAEVQAIYMGALMRRRKHASLHAVLDDREPRRPLRPRPRAAGCVAHARARRARGRRPQRHGQDHAVQRDHRPGARAKGSIKLAGEEILGLAAARDHASRASATCRRAGGCGRRSRSTSTCACVVRNGPWTRGARLPDLPAPRRAQAQRRRRALRRRAADARDRARAAVQPAAAGDGRAHRGPRAGHRPAGRRRC